MADSLFSLTHIRGMNDTDPSISLPEDQCTVAMNVEFDKSACGERRNGCVDVDLPTSITGNGNIQAITFAHRHLPTTDETASELWIMGQHYTAQHVVMTRKTTSWTDATFTDAIEVTGGQGVQVAAQTLHGKLFLAYPSVGGVDRLHVVDASGTAVRRTGLAQPAAPTAVDNGGAGTYVGKRYFRVRYTVQDGSGNTLRRSEPSDVLTFTPNGTSLNARVTKPASISENETHWELEASLTNSDFRVLITLVVGTTTYDDSTAFAAGYAPATLSEDVEDYSLIPSGKFLASDEDRLLIGGSWENTAHASRVAWTPVFNAEGNGNDERLELDTDPFIDLDGFEGGPLTHLSNPVNGFIWAFKRSHTYRLVRTNQRNHAYAHTKVSDGLGALPGSVVQGVDQFGMPCLYFLDPETGPCRTGGARLITAASRDILTTWRTVDLDAVIACRGLYYPESRQVHWWVTLAGNDYPSLKLVLQTNHTRDVDDGVRNGWSMADGIVATAHTACLYADNIDSNTTRSLTLRPFIGVTAANGYVLRCDTGVDDDGTDFAARLVTRPFVLRSLLGKFKVLGAAVLAKANATATLVVRAIRDFGLEEPSTTTLVLAATGDETDVVKRLPRTFMPTQMLSMQLEFTDAETPDGQWQLNRVDMRMSMEESG